MTFHPCGEPGATRTRGLQSRSLTLYPTELMAHNTFYYTPSFEIRQGPKSKIMPNFPPVIKYYAQMQLLMRNACQDNVFLLQY